MSASVEMIYCACGCGNTRTRYDAKGRERTFLNNHDKRVKNLPEEKIKDMYLGKELDSRKIAKTLGTSKNTVLRRLESLGVDRRDCLEFTPNTNKIPKEAIEFIVGELLGDGCVFSQNPVSANYAHSSKYKEYLNWLSSLLSVWGIEKSGEIRKLNNGCFTYQSRFYRDLAALRKRFYPKGKKVVPIDIRLTPIILRQWYIGDGSYLVSKRCNSRAIMLYTMGFRWNDVERLTALLGGLGIESIHTTKNTIRIRSKSVDSFFEYIGSCPKEIVDIYGYKWGIGERRKTK